MQNSSSSTIKRLSIIVSGTVQGVGYRFFTKDNADRFRLTGWVRNCMNGNVEIEAQGEDVLLGQFCKDLKKGPMFGYVSDLQKREIEIKPEEESFYIRHY